MTSSFTRYSVEDKVPTPTGSRHSLITPFNVYITNDKPIVICAANNSLFGKLCLALGKPELATDKRFLNNMERVENTTELEIIINNILKTKSAKEWLDIFNNHGVPAGPINNMAEVFQEPQLNYRNMIAHFSDHYMPNARFPGNPIKFSNYPDTNEYLRGPHLDEHREEIMKLINEK
jgi:CoA:oxalate CoA-transferase